MTALNYHPGLSVSEPPLRASGGIFAKRLGSERLIEVYAERLLRMAVALAGEPQTAEEVVENTFTAAKRAGRSHGSSSLLVWLTRLFVQQVTPLPDARRQNFHSPQPMARTGQDVSAALLSLAPDLRLLVVLREMQQLSYDELAEITGLSRPLIVTQLSHARRELLRLLDPSRLSRGKLPEAAPR